MTETIEDILMKFFRGDISPKMAETLISQHFAEEGLRDSFAMAALPTLLIPHKSLNDAMNAEEIADVVADAAYTVADGMMRVRSQRKS